MTDQEQAEAVEALLADLQMCLVCCQYGEMDEWKPDWCIECKASYFRMPVMDSVAFYNWVEGRRKGRP